MKNRFVILVLTMVSVVLLGRALYSLCSGCDRRSWYVRMGIPLGWYHLGQASVTERKMRGVAIALEKYSRDHSDQYPIPPIRGQPLVFSHDFWRHLHANQQLGEFIVLRPARRVIRLRPLLEGKYIDTLPTEDFWGGPLYYDISADRLHYILISLGSDWKVDAEWKLVFSAEETFHDIVMYDGSLVSFAEGMVQ